MTKVKIGLTLFSILLAVVKASEVFKIYRRKPEGVSGSEGATDSFKIPFSLCQLNASDAVNCKKFNARPVSYNSEKCFCSCRSENNTFIFTDGQWTCLKNSALRVLLGEYEFLFSFMATNMCSGTRKQRFHFKQKETKQKSSV